ncbi:tafazzin-like isoform X2 [Apostichopus japonicus]
MPLEPWQWKHTNHPGILRKSASCLTILGVVTLGKLWGKLANSVLVVNTEDLQKKILHREKGVPLVTVSNHLSCVDDPVLLGNFSFKSFLFPSRVRWLPGASDIAFMKNSHVWFFTLGQIVPIVRGDGVYQPSMDFIIDKVNDGGWVHFFPEGKVNMTKEFLRLKWGIGRVIAESKINPLVVPYWHIGMDHILPNYPPYIPRVGKKVTMLIGDAMDFKEMLAQMRNEKRSPMEMRKQITDAIQEELGRLKARTEALHYDR